MANAQNTVQAGKQTTTPFESAFVGSYRQGSVDVVSELALFNDNTFCYSVMAGALDQLIVGRWSQIKATTGVEITKGIFLTEVRPAGAPIYPLMGSLVKRAGGMNEIVFDGRSLSEANSPVFAISNSEALPATFKPLFSDNMGSWAESYFYPQIQADQAKYLYIGDMPEEANGQRQKLRVVQYKLDQKFDSYRVYFDMATARPPLNLSAQLNGGTLFVDGERWGAKKVQTQKWMDEAKATCAAAAGSAASPDSEGGKSENGKSESVKQALLNLVVPLKTYQLDKKVIAGQAIFDKTYDSAKHGYDSNEEIIKQETAALSEAYAAAKTSSAKIDAYLQLSKQIVDANVRLKEHSAPLADQYAQLINATNTKRDFQSTTKVLFHFVNHILTGIDPYIASLDKGEKRQSQYRLSVIASQSLAASVETKNEAMSQLVFNKILTPKFDIKTHENATLIYNLACFYALKGNKPQMLEAVVQARLRGKPAKQFLDDTDFKDYLNDADFQAALK